VPKRAHPPSPRPVSLCFKAFELQLRLHSRLVKKGLAGKNEPRFYFCFSCPLQIFKNISVSSAEKVNNSCHKVIIISKLNRQSLSKQTSKNIFKLLTVEVIFIEDPYRLQPQTPPFF
jgi:hypothetical protein